MAGAASANGSSNTIGYTIPGSSRIFAALSTVPFLLVIAGLLFYVCLSHIWTKITKRHLKSIKPRWKPLSLRTPTLLLYLALTLALILLLESASLALPGSQTDVTTDDSSSATSTYTFVPAQTSDMSAAYSDITSEPLAKRGGGPTAPAPNIGWLSLGDDGWLSAQTSYFIGTFVPTLVASLFSILWKVLDTETKTLEPFAQLATPGGGTASNTILLHYSGIHGFLSSITGLFNGHVAVTLSTVLKYSSALLIPLAAEAVHLKLQGGCLQDWTDHCTAVLQASDPVIRIAQALLAFMACLNLVYLVLVSRRRLGVSFDPRSILGMASLAINPYLSALMRRLPTGSDGMFLLDEASSTLGKHKFEFGHITYLSGEQEYGIIVTNGDTQDQSPLAKSTTTKVNTTQSSTRSMLLSVLMILGFAMFIIGICILILYYRLTDDNTGFERFMDSQSTFGVRFLFTVFGLIIGFGWAAIFQGK
ncbi:hypothetical protein FVEN_g8174 [Fusarium venenatum]|nr:hypothetical protein FVEN_g8174 [Fusarium venenatum]